MYEKKDVFFLKKMKRKMLMLYMYQTQANSPLLKK